VRLLGLAVLVGVGVAISAVADYRKATERAQQPARANSRLRRDLRRANRTTQPRGSRSR
jgi:hypothetical protein